MIEGQASWKTKPRGCIANTSIGNVLGPRNRAGRFNAACAGRQCSGQRMRSAEGFVGRAHRSEHSRLHPRSSAGRRARTTRRQGHRNLRRRCAEDSVAQVGEHAVARIAARRHSRARHPISTRVADRRDRGCRSKAAFGSERPDARRRTSYRAAADTGAARLGVCGQCLVRTTRVRIPESTLALDRGADARDRSRSCAMGLARAPQSVRRVRVTARAQAQLIESVFPCPRICSTPTAPTPPRA